MDNKKGGNSIEYQSRQFVQTLNLNLTTFSPEPSVTARVSVSFWTVQGGPEKSKPQSFGHMFAK